MGDLVVVVVVVVGGGGGVVYVGDHPYVADHLLFYKHKLDSYIYGHEGRMNNIFLSCEGQ